MSEKYKLMSRPPATALRQITGGDLKGKTDINPQWRYEIMDEVFGPCGEGWKYEIVKLWDYPTADGTVLCFAQINVYVRESRDNAEMHQSDWSEPIPGLGGNTLVDMVKGYGQDDEKRAKPNDEGYKMAITDALGTALKMRGVAADVYAGRWDGSKYRDDLPPGGDKTEASKETPEIVKLKNAVIDFSNITPPVFNQEWLDYATDMCSKNSVTGMQACIDQANKVLKRREEKQ